MKLLHADGKLVTNILCNITVVLKNGEFAFGDIIFGNG